MVKQKGLSNLGPEAGNANTSMQTGQWPRLQSSDDSKQTLSDWAESFDFPYMMVLSGIVKVGQAGSWDLLFGAITSNNSYTRIKGALIDSRSGERVWQNEVQLRAIPVVDNKDFTTSIQTLFLNLKAGDYESTND